MIAVDKNQKGFIVIGSSRRSQHSNHCKLYSEEKYLTEREVESLMDYARKHSRYGHRDSTMILVAYRHGLRASELCDLQWHQVELDAGRMHVRRAKNGTPRSIRFGEMKSGP